ncbi:unnamed protein product [Hermetia illucens]|uniref:PCI domain-containing protein n=2 Tax=Hermetia illucens TaxID=343691 RepID=A0A7R8UC13_HERIL|nr:unnamed protein product [Hermetia illucens]
MEVDYSSACDEKIPVAKELAKNEKTFHEAIDVLLQVEKDARMGSDLASTIRILIAIVEICYEHGNWNALNEYIVVLSRKRSQFKEAISKMVQHCLLYLTVLPDLETKLRLIDTLRLVTEGKIYVEVERARLTRMLAKIKEDGGDLDAATALMAELHVETYGTMEKREKIELILEQMRLFILKHDFDKAQILAKKISVKFFDDPQQEELKLKYYKLKITMDKDSSFLETSRHYQALFNCLTLDEHKKNELIMNAVMYCVLAPYYNEQHNMMHILSENLKLKEITLFNNILQLFTSKELIDYNGFEKGYGCELLKTAIFDQRKAVGVKHWRELKSRIIEHNIRIISYYYTRIYLGRMSELLNISKRRCEDYITKLVSSGTVSIKIDRPSDIVYFTKKKQPSDVLNDWSKSVDQFMKLVNHTAHLINKEQCLNNVLNESS